MFAKLFKLILWAFAIIGVGVIIVAVGAIAFLSYRLPAAKSPPQNIVLSINFKQELHEQDNTMPRSLRAVYNHLQQTDEDEALSLRDVVTALERGAQDPKVKGMVGWFGDNLPPLAQTQEIRAALATFRAAGKFTYAYSTSYGNFGPGNNAYYLASAFEQIWLQPVGIVGISGLRIENPFGRAVLDKIGVKADFIQREDYKNVMSFLTEDTMPAPMREQMSALLTSLNNQLIDGIATGRKLPRDAAQTLLAQGPYTATEAMAKKLIDRIGYEDELAALVNEKSGKNATKLAVADYLAFPENAVTAEAATLKTPPTPHHVALIIASGEITNQGSAPSLLSGGEAGVDTKEIVKAFAHAAASKDIKIILFRVDSPGGSPTASESIRRAMMKAQEAGKTVIVSMGQMAGSGGYWIAMNADRIFANPATLTGSIGVVGGKLDLSALYEKIGLKWEALDTGEYGGLWSMSRGFTPPERVRMEALLDDTYQTFRLNVSKARKIPLEKMPDVSKGRVFTGEQAVKIGLVDEIGGLEAAIGYAKTLLKLPPATPLVVNIFPPQDSPSERVQKLFKFLLRGDMSQALSAAATLPFQQRRLATLLPPVQTRMMPMIVQ